MKQRLMLLIAGLGLCLTPVFAKSAPRAARAPAKAPASRVKVKTYVKKDGKVVQAHQRTAPDHTQRDNWSAKGQVNPVTGKPGTKKATK